MEWWCVPRARSVVMPQQTDCESRGRRRPLHTFSAASSADVEPVRRAPIMWSTHLSHYFSLACAKSLCKHRSCLPSHPSHYLISHHLTISPRPSPTHTCTISTQNPSCLLYLILGVCLSRAWFLLIQLNVYFWYCSMRHAAFCRPTKSFFYKKINKTRKQTNLQLPWLHINSAWTLCTWHVAERIKTYKSCSNILPQLPITFIFRKNKDRLLLYTSSFWGRKRTAIQRFGFRIVYLKPEQEKQQSQSQKLPVGRFPIFLAVTCTTCHQSPHFCYTILA